VAAKTEAYYENSPFKPGVMFWRSLFGQHQTFAESKRAIEASLKFHIPNTFVYEGSQSYSLIFVDGSLKVEEDPSPEAVLTSFRILDQTQPAAVRKRACPGHKSLTTAIPGALLGSIVRNVSDIGDLVCIQEYCKLSRLSGKPSFVRLHYSPTSVPFGYHISHKDNPNNLSEQTEANLTRQFCVSFETSSRESLLIYKVVGKSIRETADIAKSIFTFIEVFFKIRLTDIIIDFIGSTVVQVKSFTVKPQAVPKLIVSSPNRAAVRNCYVCKQGKDDLSKFVTYKMIFECFESLQRRGIETSIYDNTKRLSDWGTYKCCDICYSLILNEQELNKISKKVFKAIPFSVPVEDETPGPIITGDQVRMFVGVENFNDSPFSQNTANSRVEIGFGNKKIIISPLESYFLLELIQLAPCDWGSINVRILDARGDVVGSGTVSSDFLARVSSHLVTVPVYLGKGRWNISMVFGIQITPKISVHNPLGEHLVQDNIFWLKEPLRWEPVPDEWLSTMKKFRRGRRRRSRSGSTVLRL
jgi:hypothetical protein